MAQKLNKTQLIGTENSASVEIDTGEKWVDGRVIYKKAVVGTITLTNGSSTMNHGISGLTTSFQILNVTGNIKIGVSNGISAGSQTLWYRETGGNWAHFTSVNQTVVTWNSSFSWGSSYVALIVTYVK